MARIQHVVFNLCAEIRAVSVGQLHESWVCQNLERAVKQYTGVLSPRSRPLAGRSRGTDVPVRIFLYSLFNPRGIYDLRLTRALFSIYRRLASVQRLRQFKVQVFNVGGPSQGIEV